MAFRFEVPLRKAESQIRRFQLDTPWRMSFEERYELIQNLVAEIDAERQGQFGSAEYRQRFSELSELNQLAVRKLITGLQRFGYVEPDFDWHAHLQPSDSI